MICSVDVFVRRLVCENLSFVAINSCNSRVTGKFKRRSVHVAQFFGNAMAAAAAAARKAGHFHTNGDSHLDNRDHGENVFQKASLFANR